MALPKRFLVYFASKMSCGAIMTVSAANFLFRTENHFRTFHTGQIAFDDMLYMHQRSRWDIRGEVRTITNGFHFSWFVSGVGHRGFSLYPFRG